MPPHKKRQREQHPTLEVPENDKTKQENSSPRPGDFEKSPTTTSTTAAIVEPPFNSVPCSASSSSSNAASAFLQQDAQQLQQTSNLYHSFETKLRQLNALKASVRHTDSVASSLVPHLPPLVPVNVGGTAFDVPEATLRRFGDSFFAQLLEGRIPMELDDQGRLFIDRDPVTFAHLLRYMRGYTRVMPTAEERVMLEHDAAFYNIPQLTAHLSTAPREIKPHMITTPGPGVNADQTRIRNIYCVALVGDRYLASGRHSITFELVNTEYLGVGCVADDFNTSDSEYYKTLNSCVYYMTGVLYSNFPTHRKEEGLPPFEAGDRVTIILDMLCHVIEFHVRDTIKTVPCPTAARLRFAAVMKLNAQVRIVEPPIQVAVNADAPRGAASRNDKKELVLIEDEH